MLFNQSHDDPETFRSKKYFLVSISNIVIFFLFAFAMTAACNSYLAWNVESFLAHFLFFFIIYSSPAPFYFYLVLYDLKTNKNGFIL